MKPKQNPFLKLPTGDCVRRDSIVALVRHEAIDCIGITRPTGILVHFTAGAVGHSAFVPCTNSTDRDALAKELAQELGMKGRS